jgi:hypothetical protein
MNLLIMTFLHTGREADHSPPSSAEVKEWVELYLHSTNTPSWRGALLTHRDNFTFTFYLLPFTWSKDKGTTNFHPSTGSKVYLHVNKEHSDVSHTDSYHLTPYVCLRISWWTVYESVSKSFRTESITK